MYVRIKADTMRKVSYLCRRSVWCRLVNDIIGTEEKRSKLWAFEGFLFMAYVDTSLFHAGLKCYTSVPKVLL